jgi:hypothetical protein
MLSRSDTVAQVSRTGDALDRMVRGLTSRAMLVLLVLLGAVLRIYQYAADRSLWLDEAALAHNIIQRGFGHLAAPLDFAQLAPLGFLWLEKCAVLLLGSSEYALRLLPLLASLAALVLFALVARRILPDVAAPFALLLFATAPQLIYFASETKQYAFDTAGALAIVLMALEARERGLTGRRAVVFGVAGGLLPWFTQPSVFVLAAAAAYLLFTGPHTGRTRTLTAYVPMLALWTIGAALAAWHGLHSLAPGDAAYLRTFWHPAFLPVQSGVAASLQWISDLARGAFQWHFAPRLPWVALALFVLGAVYFALRVRALLVLVLGPIVFALAASALHLYPVFSRLTLFVAPSLFLTVGAGAALLLAVAGERPVARAAAFAALGIIALLSLTTARYLPILREELRPVAQFVALHRKPGDTIYVYYGAAQAFRYYAPREGIPDSAFTVGACARTDWRGYTAQLDSLRGRPRVWLVLSHPFLRGGIREDSLFTTYLAHIGHRVEGVATYGALGALYDLRGPAPDSGAYSPPVSGDDSGARETCSGVVAGG